MDDRFTEEIGFVMVDLEVVHSKLFSFKQFSGTSGSIVYNLSERAKQLIGF